MIPLRFRKSSEGALANYDFVDIAEGTGVVIFYGGATETSAGITYLFSKNAFYSEYTTIIFGVGTNTRNFDTGVFNLPKAIKGTAYFSVGLYTQSGGANAYLKVTVQKSSGGAITNCSSQISSATINGNGAYNMLMIPIPLTTTHFKKGDFLRVEVSAVNSLNAIEYGTDPMGRPGTYLTGAVLNTMTTKMQLYMPFQLDL